MPSDALFQAATARVVERCALLTECSDSPSGLTRLFCSDAMRAAHAQIADWMTAAGLEVRLDAAGNLIGRRSGADESPRAILIGSHIDTVINAGRYDGTLGAMMGLALAELCHEEDISLPVALDVIAFSEEEGVRYQTPYIGSRAIAGEIRPGDPLLERLDASGVRMGDALLDFGCDPEQLAAAAYDPSQVVAFIEPHIEQGPVLEQQDAPLAVVTGVAGQTRACFRFTGGSGHAGTVPMSLRRDPMPAAAAFICQLNEAIERLNEAAGDGPEMVATVGRLEVAPNVANVIPESVAVRLDLRHMDDTQREACFETIRMQAMAVAAARGVDCRLEWCEQQPATWCDEACMAVLEDALCEENLPAPRMPSGAGHDAVAMAKRFPTSLLFLRCGGGVSHHPDESVDPSDIEAALRVLWRAINKLAHSDQESPQTVAAPQT